MNKFLRWYITSTSALSMLLAAILIFLFVLGCVYPTNERIDIAVFVIMGLAVLDGCIVLALPISNRIRNPKEK